MLIFGLLVLTVGAELLVRGGSRLALAAGISPLVVGLTVVAYGTSTPELVVSVQSALNGQSEVALGNVIGSNIFNVLLILGISAAITPLTVAQQLIRFDVPLMIAVSILTLGLSLDGRLGLIDGTILASGMLGYTVWAILKSRQETAAIKQEYQEEFGTREPVRPLRSILLNLGLVAIGLVLLAVGARWFVDSAISLARMLGVSELIIGLTIVAAGTSMPEVATSIMAAIRGERDIAVGNVVGSNIFNLLGVLGISGIVSDSGIEVSSTALQVDFPIMVATAVACLPIFFTGHEIARWEGGLFLTYYALYTTSLILSASYPQIAPTFNTAVLLYFVPLTAITLIIGVYRFLRKR